MASGNSSSAAKTGNDTPAGIIVGKPGPKYVLTIFYGDSTKKVIAMSRHDLDVFFDVDFEAFQSVIDTTPTVRSWYKDFPWAYPNEIDVRHFVFNQEADPIYANKDVRWALALALDIVDLQTEYIGGVAKVTVMPVPPTAALSKKYHTPWKSGCPTWRSRSRRARCTSPTIRRSPTRSQPGPRSRATPCRAPARSVRHRLVEVRSRDIAEKLLVKNGFSRDGNGKWLKPDGTPWTLEIQSPPDENDAFRMANAATDHVERLRHRREPGRVWSAACGTRMSRWSVRSQHTVVQLGRWPPAIPGRRCVPGSDLYVPIGEDVPQHRRQPVFRINDPEVGELIDDMVPVSPGQRRELRDSSANS